MCWEQQVNEWVDAGTLARVHRVCPFFGEGHLQRPVTLMLDIASEEEKEPTGGGSAYFAAG